MPALPEIEVLKRGLDKEVVGRRVRGAEVRGGSHAMNAVRRHPKRKDFVELLSGNKFERVGRVGRWLALGLDSGNSLVVALGESARLLKTPSSEPVQANTHVVLDFTIGGQLRFVDPGRGGEMFVASPDELAGLRSSEPFQFQIDPLDGSNPVAWQHFSQLLTSRAVPVKRLLMDEGFVVGLGDLYSDEVLFTAGLRYDRASNELSAQDVRRLYRALLEILTDAVKAGGASVGAHPFTDLAGLEGSYQNELKVFGREGLACPRCRNTIIAKDFEGITTHFCPQCQS